MDNLRTADHTVMYSHATSPREKQWESWYYEQRLPYPTHPQRYQLIDAYEGAREAHAQAVKVVQFAVGLKRENPEEWDDKDFEQCQKKVVATKEAMQEAEADLRAFNQHTPQERISLYESEIANLEEQLTEALAEEHAFTEQLLADPEAARKRLQRQLDSGNGAEYSETQLAELRTLRNKVESLRSQIQRHRWDIQRIEELAAEAEERVALQAKMDTILPRFSKACSKFVEAMDELKAVADEHNVHLDTRGLKVPRGATFRLSSGVYDGVSTIALQWE